MNDTTKKILIFSDCFVYSGSENVIENILNDSAINAIYDIQFYYAYNQIYEEGIKRRFKTYENIHSLKTLSAYHLWGYPLHLAKSKGDSKLLIIKTLQYWFFAVLEKLKFFNIINLIRLYKLFNKEKPHI